MQVNLPVIKADQSFKTVTFLLSSDHSGSTWVGYVLGSNPDTAFLGEFWRAWNPALKQPCSWCMAHDRSDCEVLHGIEEVSSSQAYEFALSRIQKSHLIDISKRVEWAQKFIAPNSQYQARLIHLIRDPRGWYASARRRCSGSTSELLKHWLEENIQIRAFLERSQTKSATVFYDEIAGKPALEFAELCRLIGCQFELDSLRYWEKTHHGFAANGASSLLLSSTPNAAALPHLITGDDAYYKQQGRTSFIDLRWKQQLTGPELTEITENSDVAGFLSLYRRTLAPEGLCHQKMSDHAFPWQLENQLA